MNEEIKLLKEIYYSLESGQVINVGSVYHFTLKAYFEEDSKEKLKKFKKSKKQ